MYRAHRMGQKTAEITAEMGVLLQMSWALVLLISATSVVSESVVPAGNKAEPQPLALVENLGVVAVRHDLKARSLQLYVNWTAPTEGNLPESYFLRVKSINESTEYCGTMDFVADINSTETWFLVPPEVSEVANDPHVFHECTYNVRVESRPYGGRRAPELNYTVPELVDNLWSCRRKATLPQPRDLHVSVVNHTTVAVAWQMDAADAKTVQGFSIKLGTEIESTLRDWFDYGPEVVVNVSNCNGSGGGGALRMEHRLVGDLSRRVQYLVEVSVVDCRGCRGPPAEARFRSTGSESTSWSQTVLLVVVPLVVLVAAAAVTRALLCRGRSCWQEACGRRRQQPAQPWLDGYSTVAAVQSNGHSSISDVTSHPGAEMEVSYASDIELLGIKASGEDM